jgi:hypothetical protein
MPFQPAGAISVACFLAICAVVIASFLAIVHRAYRADPARAQTLTLRAALFLAAMVAVFSALTLSGRLPTLPLAGVPFFFLPAVVMAVVVGLSPVGRAVAAGVPLAWLVAFQGFRLPLELVLHHWSDVGTIPVTMTWTGQNWDIVSGGVALACAPFANRHRVAAWLGNLVGGVLLLNVVRVATLSSPVPFGWDVKPPLVLIYHYPYSLIGPVCVAGAMVGHIWLTRALLRPHSVG